MAPRLHLEGGLLSIEGGFDPQYTYLKSSKAYYTRAAYGLLRAGQALKEPRYVDATRRHFDWVVSLQRPDGWIDHWGFDETFAVLHTIAYTLRGLIEAGVAAERLTAEGVGGSEPLFPNISDRNRMRNNRVEFVLE